VEPPHIRWKPQEIYACFLSHYKMEAASDARYMHDMLRKMLLCPVFLDSSSLSDLRDLIAEGLHKSDVVVLLASNGVLTRPWCLIELLETVRRNIPVVVVRTSRSTFSFSAGREFVANLEDEMQRLNPGGLSFLRGRLGELDELKEAVSYILEQNERLSVADRPLLFESGAGDQMTVAMMMDIVERMLQVTGRHRSSWTSAGGDHLKRKQRTTRKNTLPRVGREFSRNVSIGSSRDPKSPMGLRNVSCRRMSAHSLSNFLRAQKESDNLESAVFLCCSRKDAIYDARVLRCELAVRLGRGCTIGGRKGNHQRDVEFLQRSDLFLVLLTKNLTTDTSALLQIFMALEFGIPMATLILTGAGYDYEAAATAYHRLPEALEENEPGSSLSLKKKLPDRVTVAQVGEKIHASLTAIIAIAWSPAWSDNAFGAVVDEIIARMRKRQSSIRKLFKRGSLERLETSQSRKTDPDRVTTRELFNVRETSEIEESDRQACDEGERELG